MGAARRFVFKVAPRAQWEAACSKGGFTGSADDVRDGFIHLSLRTQLAGTLAKHFRNQHDLVLIQFETRDLGEALRWEVSRGGEEFPHLYGVLPTAQAVAVHRLPIDADGVPQLPEDLAV